MFISPEFLILFGHILMAFVDYTHEHWQTDRNETDLIKGVVERHSFVDARDRGDRFDHRVFRRRLLAATRSLRALRRIRPYNIPEEGYKLDP